MAQLAWYSLMISEDKIRELDKNLSYLDYHASFLNHEGVMKAKEFRNSQKEESIKETDEFLDLAKKNEFKNNPLIEAIKKIRELNTNPKEENLFNSINLNKLIREDI